MPSKFQDVWCLRYNQKSLEKVQLHENSFGLICLYLMIPFKLQFDIHFFFTTDFLHILHILHKWGFKNFASDLFSCSRQHTTVQVAWKSHVTLFVMYPLTLATQIKYVFL